MLLGRFVLRLYSAGSSFTTRADSAARDARVAYRIVRRSTTTSYVAFAAPHPSSASGVRSRAAALVAALVEIVGAVRA